MKLIKSRSGNGKIHIDLFTDKTPTNSRTPMHGGFRTIFLPVNEFLPGINAGQYRLLFICAWLSCGRIKIASGI